MFIDVCFPNKNEKKFLEIAKSISTEDLLFLYKSKKDEENYFGYLGGDSKKIAIKLKPLERVLSKDQKQHYFYCDDKKGTFHAPTKKVNQVVFKELAEKNKFLVLPFSCLLKNHPRHVEQLAFVVGLCKKYGVNMFFSSFATTPYELRSKYELLSFAKLMGADRKNLKINLDMFVDFLN